MNNELRATHYRELTFNLKLYTHGEYGIMWKSLADSICFKRLVNDSRGSFYTQSAF